MGATPSSDSALTALDARLPLNGNVALVANFTGRFSDKETAVGGYGGVQIIW